MRTDPVGTAYRLVADRFPDARAAWLGGSVVRGDATATSDLDVTVLLDGPPAPYRHSIAVGHWPVELFVHTEASLAHYRDQDLARRRPSLMRLVGESVVLHDRDGSGARLRQEMREVVTRGPAPLTAEELASARYVVTDLLLDLQGAADDVVRSAVAATLWREAAVLLLTGARRWSGAGKGLVRELRAYDADCGTTYTQRLTDALRAAIDGDAGPLTQVCDEVLEQHGGRLFEGHRLAGEAPDRYAEPPWAALTRTRGRPCVAAIPLRPVRALVSSGFWSERERRTTYRSLRETGANHPESGCRSPSRYVALRPHLRAGYTSTAYSDRPPIRWLTCAAVRRTAATRSASRTSASVG